MNNETFHHITQDAKLSVNKLPLNKNFEITIDHALPWMKALLTELNEEVGAKQIISPSNQGELKFEGSYYKKNKSEYGDFVIITGTLSARYFTSCSQSGKTMQDEIVAECNACILSESFKVNPDYKDEIELYVDAEMRDLFFQKHSYVLLNEVFHEYLYLNKNPYPRINKEENGSKET